MSRIDDALRRAALATGPAALAAHDATRRADESLLEHYPHETHPVTRGFTRKPKTESRIMPALPAVSDPREIRASEEAEAKLVKSSGVTSVPAEQYRRLAAAVHELQEERGVKTLMVTSAVPQEGKTLTVTNLALTLSESYSRRVLLIDADLRRPSIHRLLSIPNQAGLSDVLAGYVHELPLIQVSQNLSVLPSGRPKSNPLAGLISEQMRSLLHECESRFDWVLLDAPPVGLISDAQLLARQTQGVIFVIRAGSTPFPVVERAIIEIGRESIVGTVLNRVDAEAIPARDYYGTYTQVED